MVTPRLHAFGRDRRVRSRLDFVRIQGEGRRVTTPHFVLLVARRPKTAAPPTAADEAKRPRLGLVVTRKIGGAVRRNRVKRLCRECFRTWPDLLPDGVDLVVIARSGAATLTLEAVRAEWRNVASLLRRRASDVLAERSGVTHLSRAPHAGRGAEGLENARDAGAKARPRR